MKRSLAIGLPMALLGTLLAAVPTRLLPVCEAPMRCHWTGTALAGFGAAFFLSGAPLFLCRDSGVRLGVSLAALLWAGLGIAVPTLLIGMCASPAMPCRTGTYPAALIVLALLAAAALIDVLYLNHLRTQEKGGDETADDIQHRAREH